MKALHRVLTLGTDHSGAGRRNGHGCRLVANHRYALCLRHAVGIVYIVALEVLLRHVGRIGRGSRDGLRGRGRFGVIGIGQGGCRMEWRQGRQ